MFGNQGATALEGLEYSRSTEQTARKGLEWLGIRGKRSTGTRVFGNQGATAREGPEYSRSSEQTARKGLEWLGIREQTAREGLE